MDTITVELELSSEQYGQLSALAQARQRLEKEVATIALAEWLESQARLEQARNLMRELGKGLGKGDGKRRDVARNHDRYLLNPVTEPTPVHGAA
ncbi:MAG: hypothetical protein CVU38_19120 [Chloroflexi bacterium HGW-Chloroflexi-1]|nr:MAG: hypothetical protein CVU38_19120 [Chloroflexi bacterium HGW-Chloroflexi-1]